jgi:hypothetical protein
MEPLELAATAARALAEPGTVGVVLTVPKGGLPRSFPRGELLNEMERSGRIEHTYHCDPSKVIAWLLRNGLVEMERTGERTLSFREPNRRVHRPDTAAKLLADAT